METYHLLTMEFLLVEGDLELAQSVFMILSIRLEEFKLDTSVGLESDNMFGKKLQ